MNRFLCRTIPLVLLAVVPRIAAAQNPTRLPGVEVRAKRQGLGPSLVTGVAKDTNGFTIEGMEITIPKLARRALSRDDGSFRFEGIPVGKYPVRARKFGYAPQVRTVEVDSMGGIVDFDVVPMPRALPMVYASAVGGGLSGIVADTSFTGVEAAIVRVLSKGMQTITDSTGWFFLPAPAGTYMMSVEKPGFEIKIIGVTIPPDSGRRLSIFMSPPEPKTTHREGYIVNDLESRMAWRNRFFTTLFTREEMMAEGMEWVYQAVNAGGMRSYDRDCSVVLNGGLKTALLGSLTTDEVESVEVYGGGRDMSGQGQTRLVKVVVAPSSRGNGRTGAAAFKGLAPAENEMVKPPERLAQAPLANLDQVRVLNRGKFCPEAIYVWLR